MRRNHITLIIIALITVIIALLWILSSRTEYDVIDFFSDSTGRGKIVFMFVEVDNLEKKKLTEYSKDIFNNHEAMEMKNDSVPLILIAHFYRLSDTARIPPDMLEILQKKYPNKPEVTKKLYYIPKAFVYTGFSKKIKGTGIPQDSLFASPVLVPKPGVKAKDILKR